MNIRTQTGETPMMLAVQNCSAKSLYVLLNSGADSTLESNFGENIFSLHDQYNYPKIEYVLE